jgi:hypothetical protein
MSLAAPVLLAVLCAAPAAPSSAVVLSRRAELPAKEALQAAKRVHEALAASSVKLVADPAAVAASLKAAGVADSASCDGKLECAARLAGLLGVPVLVTVEVGALGKSLAMHLEAIAGAERVAEADLVVDRFAIKTKALSGLGDFPQKVKDALERSAPPAVVVAELARPAEAAPTPPPASDAPRKEPEIRPAAPTPAPEPAVAGLGSKVRPEPSRAPAYVCVGGAVAAAGAAVALLILGKSAEGSIGLHAVGGEQRASVPEARAQTLASRANAEYIASGVAGGVAVALGVVATALLATR